MDVGAVLREARVSAGLTQAEVARLASVTRHALSRWETSTRPVRSDVADRILAACGADVRMQLVARQADLDAALSQLASLSVQDRVGTLRGLLSTHILDALQATGGAVFTGAWAALALGLPSLTTLGGLLVSGQVSAQAQVSAVLARMQPLSLAPGGPWGITWDGDVFQRNPSGTFETVLIGRFSAAVVPGPVPELRLETPTGPWRVVTPEQLVPDSVDGEVVERWRALAT